MNVKPWQPYRSDSWELEMKRAWEKLEPQRKKLALAKTINCGRVECREILKTDLRETSRRVRPPDGE